MSLSQVAKIDRRARNLAALRDQVICHVSPVLRQPTLVVASWLTWWSRIPKLSTKYKTKPDGKRGLIGPSEMLFIYSMFLVLSLRWFCANTSRRRPTGEPVGVVRPQPTDGTVSPASPANFAVGEDDDEDTNERTPLNPDYADLGEDRNVWGN